jgi:hypothetical protein
VKLPPPRPWPEMDILVGITGAGDGSFRRYTRVPIEVVVPIGLQLFHGTSAAAEFTIPNGPASFSIDTRTAQLYADNEGEGVNPRVIPFVTTRTAKCIDHPGVGAQTEQAEFWLKRWAQEVHGLHYREMRDWGMVGAMRLPELLEFLRSKGYDGMVIRKLDDGGTEVCLFEPEKFVKPSIGESMNEGRQNSTAMVIIPSDPPGRNVCGFIRKIAQGRSKVLVVGQSGKLAPGNLQDLLMAQLPDVTKIEVIDMADTGGESVSDAVEALAAQGLYKSGQALEVWCSPDVARGFAEEIKSGQLDLDPTTISVHPEQVPSDDLVAIMQAFTDEDVTAMKQLLDPHIFSDPAELPKYRDALLHQGGGLFIPVSSIPVQNKPKEGVVREARSAQKKKILTPLEIDRIFPTAMTVWDRDVPADEPQDDTTFYTFEQGWQRTVRLAARTPKHIWQFDPPVEVGEEPPDPGPRIGFDQPGGREWEMGRYDRYAWQQRKQQATEIGPDGRWRIVQRTPVRGTKEKVTDWAQRLGRPFSADELRSAWKDFGGGKRNMWDLVQRMPLRIVHDHGRRGWSGMHALNFYEYDAAVQPRSYPPQQEDRPELCPQCSKQRRESVMREFLTDIAPSREIAIRVLHDLLASKLSSDGLDIGDYEYLGSGRNGSAYRGDGLVLKVTTDPNEAASGMRLIGRPCLAIHLVHGVTELSEGVWLLEQEGDLEKLPQEYSEEFDLAIEMIEAVGGSQSLREGDWDGVLECLRECTEPEAIPDVLEVAERFGIPLMCAEVRALGLSADFHSGNIMLREGVPVLTDLGTPGDAPAPVSESTVHAGSWLQQAHDVLDAILDMIAEGSGWSALWKELASIVEAAIRAAVEQRDASFPGAVGDYEDPANWQAYNSDRMRLHRRLDDAIRWGLFDAVNPDRLGNPYSWLEAPRGSVIKRELDKLKPDTGVFESFQPWKKGPDWYNELHDFIDVIIDAKRSGESVSQLLNQFRSLVMDTYSKMDSEYRVFSRYGHRKQLGIGPGVTNDEPRRQLHAIIDMLLTSSPTDGPEFSFDGWMEDFERGLEGIRSIQSQSSNEDRSGGEALGEMAGTQAAPSSGASGHLKGMGSSAWSGGRQVLAAPQDNVPEDENEDEYSAALDWGFYGASR